MFPRKSRQPGFGNRRRSSSKTFVKRSTLIVALITSVAFISAYVAFAAISLSTSVPYTQNFDGMGIPASNPAPSSLPIDFRVDTISAARTLGSYFSSSASTARVAGANMATNAANGSYNFGSGSTTLGGSDRAVGFISSGTATQSGNLYAELINNTGTDLTGLEISYDVEKYRNGLNPSGFRIQLYYSADGLAWTNAGPNFLTSFPPDADNNGFATAPGLTSSVNNMLNVFIADKAKLYLAWNYSVSTGTTTTNAQALGIDNISILAQQMVEPTNPSGVGQANPNSVLQTETSVLTVTVAGGTNPSSTNLVVEADLSSIGNSASQQFFNDGVSGGDVVAGDNVFTYIATVPTGTTPGAKSLAFNVSDGEGRSGSGSIALTIQQPPPPVDHIVISQLYGGGGNSGATFVNDYVELYNPTGVSFNLAGWSLQYASATGNSWTNKQPLGGNIAPGEYFLVRLGSGGATGAAVPPANIEGDINMSATTGKLALVSNSLNLVGTCPNGTDTDIVDFVGYGSSANCFEGSNRAPATSNTSAIFRKMNGAQDSNQNGDDFQTDAPNPRRTAPIMELGPWVAGTDPQVDGVNAPYDATVTVDFSEPVDINGNWFDITCTSSGQHNSATVATFNSFKGYHITPNTSFQFGEQCTVTIFSTQVHDQDVDDSVPGTDTLFDNFTWTFTVTGAGSPAPYPPNVHLTFGNPSNAVANLLQPNNYLMEKPTYAVSYNRDKGTPNWISWHLEQDWVGSLARVDTFRADPNVPADWYRVQSTDYFASGFDRGHMTPNADRDNEDRRPINQETYLMTNMVPQSPDNNQGPWAEMENDLRSLLAGTTNEMYIVSGPLGVGGNGSNGGTTNTIANGQVTVPAFTWKVVLMMPKGDNDISRVTAATRTIAVLMPNVQGIRNDPWENYITTVDAIESLTGYDFFANVPDANENAIEAGTNGVNPPGTEDSFATVTEDVPGSISLNAVSSAASPSFTSIVVTPPSHGVLSGSGLSLTYTPASDYHGPDSFTFKVNDGSADSNTSTVSITITEVNDHVSANDDSNSTDEDTPLNFPAVDLTSNDSAGPGNESLQQLTVTSVTATADTHGSVTLNSGTVTYTPDNNYHGPASFTYEVCDDGSTAGAPDSKCATAIVNITVNAINDYPKASDDTATVDEDDSVTVDVVSNDTDADDDSRTLQSVGTAAHGTVTIVAGQAQYSPNSNYNGPDSFTYVVSDGQGGEDTGTVNVTVNPVNDGPTANGQAAVTNGNTAVGITLTGNDVETATANLIYTVTVSPAHGSLSGTGANLTYTPAMNYSGPDSFKFTVTDLGDGSAAALTSSEATVTITVNDTINPTVTAPSNVSLGTGPGATSCGLFISDATLGTATANDNSGVVSIARSGVPAGNVFPVGVTVITYTATDSAGLTSQTTQTVTVNDTTAPSLTAPAASSANANSNGQAAIPNFVPGAVASDLCSAVTVMQSPAPGTMVGIGTHTVTLTATDAVGNTRTATTTFTVKAVGGNLTFTLSVSPSTVKRGRVAMLTASWSNQTGVKKKVTFKLRYAGACGGHASIGNIGPITIQPGAQRSANLPFLVPRNACLGTYTLTLESYVDGVLNGSTMATVTVTP